MEHMLPYCEGVEVRQLESMAMARKEQLSFVF
jgi:hypothetical protein